MEDVLERSSISRWCRGQFVSLAWGQARKVKTWRQFKKRNAKEFERILGLRDQFIHTLGRKWQRQGLTALVSPVFPHAAFLKDCAEEMGDMHEYSNVWTIAGYPSAVFPVTKVLPEEQSFDDHFQDRWTQLLNLNARSSAGLPISLQMIGYPFEDEKILGIMKLLEEKLALKREVPEPVSQHTLSLRTKTKFTLGRADFQSRGSSIAERSILESGKIEMLDGKSQSSINHLNETQPGP